MGARRYLATEAALERFDAIDQPAVDALRRRNGVVLDINRFDDARKAAADRVRAAFLADTQHFNTEEYVELLSVERIRAAVGGTFLGMMLGFLP